MTQSSVTQFIEAAKQDLNLRKRLKTAMDASSCVEIGKDIGYDFTTKELQAELSKMSDEDVAEIINPGVVPRRHIDPH